MENRQFETGDKVWFRFRKHEKVGDWLPGEVIGTIITEGMLAFYIVENETVRVYCLVDDVKERKDEE